MMRCGEKSADTVEICVKFHLNLLFEKMKKTTTRRWTENVEKGESSTLYGVVIRRPGVK